MKVFIQDGRVFVDGREYVDKSLWWRILLRLVAAALLCTALCIFVLVGREIFSGECSAMGIADMIACHQRHQVHIFGSQLINLVFLGLAAILYNASKRGGRGTNADAIRQAKEAR